MASTMDIDPAQSTLSPNFANYIYDMLARGQAAASQPFQEYTGQRFAGASPLQQQAFGGIASLMGGGGGYGGGYGGGIGGGGYGQPQMRAMQQPMGGDLESARTRMQDERRQKLYEFAKQHPEMGDAEQYAKPIDKAQGFSAAMSSMRGMPADQAKMDSLFGGAPAGGGIGNAAPSLTADIMPPGFGKRGDMANVFIPQGGDMGGFGGRMGQGLGGIGGMGGGAPAYPSQFDTATRFATQAGERAGQMQYTPGQFTVGQVNAPELTQHQMEAQPQVTTQSFTQPGASGSYMSPYMQNVVDVQQQQAQRQADIANQAQKAQFAQAGAFGGGRFGVQQAQAAADLARQKQGIQATGLQSAYQQAQQQFNQEQQARLQAQQANQQAGLTTGAQNLAARLGVQQLGAGQSMQAQQANQQALMQAQQAAEQSRQFGAGYGAQGIQQQLSAAGQLGNLGQGQFGTQLSGLQTLANMGGTQQQLAQQPLDFGYQQWQQSLQYPYQQATYMQSLLGGLPLQATPYNAGQTGMASALQGGLAGLSLYNLFNKP